MGQCAVALGRNFPGDGAIIREEIAMPIDDEVEDRLRTLEQHRNALADLIEMLAKERHERLGHVLPFGEFTERGRAPSSRCADPVCVAVFDAANLGRL
jgi:hypothetical protein